MSDPFDEPDLSHVEDLFDEAVSLMQRGDHAQAKERFKRVLRAEPRLPEPYLELAIISRDEGDLDLAIEEARMGIELLERGGNWVEGLARHVVLAHAQNLLGELLVEAAQQGDIPLEPERFAPLWNEAADLFALARQTDPDNETARTNARLYVRLTHDAGSDDE